MKIISNRCRLFDLNLTAANPQECDHFGPPVEKGRSDLHAKLDEWAKNLQEGPAFKLGKPLLPANGMG